MAGAAKNDQNSRKKGEPVRKWARKKCSVPECPNGSKSKGLCKRHGGGARCRMEGCRTSAKSGGLCIRHGGGRCKVDSCRSGARKMGMCALHFRVAMMGDGSIGGMSIRSNGAGKKVIVERVPGAKQRKGGQTNTGALKGKKSRALTQIKAGRRYKSTATQPTSARSTSSGQRRSPLVPAHIPPAPQIEEPVSLLEPAFSLARGELGDPLHLQPVGTNHVSLDSHLVYPIQLQQHERTGSNGNYNQQPLQPWFSDNFMPLSYHQGGKDGLKEKDVSASPKGVEELFIHHFAPMDDIDEMLWKGVAEATSGSDNPITADMSVDLIDRPFLDLQSDLGPDTLAALQG